MGAADEIDAGIDATLNSIANTVGVGDGQAWGDRYDERVGENRRYIRAADEYDPILTNVGRLGGAIATPIKPVGWAAGGSRLGNTAKLMGEGAAYGGAYGFNSGDTMDQRLQGAASGSAVGAVTGLVTAPLASVVSKAGQRAASDYAEGAEVIPAADRLNARTGANIQPLAGHVSHGGMLSLGQAQLRPTILGGTMSGLNRAAQRFDDEIENATARVSNRISNGGRADDRIEGFEFTNKTQPLEDVIEQARNPAQKGGLGSFEADMRVRSNAAYGNAAQMAGGARLTTPRTINKIDQILAEWDEVPGGVAGAEKLRDLRDALTKGSQQNGAHTVKGLRELRTTFGDGIESGNRTLRRVAKELWPVLSKDITHGLHQQGKGAAAKAYREADRAYAKDIAVLQSVDDLLGTGARNDSAVGTMNRMLNMARNDADRLSHAVSQLDRDVANQIKGGIVDSLGKATASRSTQAGQFSLESFATNWAKMGNTAKKALFDAETINDLDDLALLARAERSVNEMGNPSRSGIFLENVRQMGLAGALAYGGGTIASGLAVGGIVLSGRVLAEPRIARAIARFARTGDKGPALKTVSAAIKRAKLNRQQPLLQDLMGLHDSIVKLNVEEGWTDMAAPETETGEMAPVEEGGEAPVSEDWSDLAEPE